MKEPKTENNASPFWWKPASIISLTGACDIRNKRVTSCTTQPKHCVQWYFCGNGEAECDRSSTTDFVLGSDENCSSAHSACVQHSAFMHSVVMTAMFLPHSSLHEYTSLQAKNRLRHIYLPWLPPFRFRLQHTYARSLKDSSKAVKIILSFF